MALKLAEGESYIEGRSPKKAKELLEKAEKAGLGTGVVRTTSTGYIVPSELADEKETAASGDESDEQESGIAEAGQASDEAAARKAEGESAEDQKAAADDSTDKATNEESSDAGTVETGGGTDQTEPSKRRGKARNSGQSDSEGDK